MVDDRDVVVDSRPAQIDALRNAEVRIKQLKEELASANKTIEVLKAWLARTRKQDKKTREQKQESRKE